MKRLRQSFSIALLLCAAAAHAQLYKSVGPDGKVTYSDTPPSHASTKVETKAISNGSGVNTAGLPYELAQAVRSQPVTLYTSRNCGAPCDNGRRLLSERGIPFSEKTVNTPEDAEQLRKVSGEDSLPLLMIGRSRERGFESGAWNTALSTAGYPETSQLPKTYRNAAAEPAAPKVVTAKQESGENTAASQPARATELPPAVGNAPPGFRF